MPPIPGAGMEGIGRGIIPEGLIIRCCAAACIGVNKTPRKQQRVPDPVRSKRRIIILSLSGDYHISTSPPPIEDRKRAPAAGANGVLAALDAFDNDSAVVAEFELML
jgi:hypothetical protein